MDWRASARCNHYHKCFNSTTTLHLHRTWWTMIVHPRVMWHFYLIVHTSLPTGWIRLKRQTCKIYDHSTQHLEPSPYCVLLHLGANGQCCKNCTVNVQSPRRAGTLSITLSLTDRWPWKTVIEGITVTRWTITIYIYRYYIIIIQNHWSGSSKNAHTISHTLLEFSRTDLGHAKIPKASLTRSDEGEVHERSLRCDNSVLIP